MDDYKKVIEDYFLGWGYNKPNVDDVFFARNYKAYLYGASIGVEPYSIDYWIEYEKLFDVKLTLEQSLGIEDLMYKEYDSDSAFELWNDDRLEAMTQYVKALLWLD